MFEDVEQRIRKGHSILFSRNSECLRELRDRIAVQKHRTLVMWALDCGGEALASFEKEYPDEKRPRMALDLAAAWSRGEIRMPAARRAILDAHAAAKDVGDRAGAALCHAIGHAAATVHVETHALGLPLYELTALVIRFGRDRYREPVLEKIGHYIKRLDYWQDHIDGPERPWAPFLLDDNRPNKEMRLIEKEASMQEKPSPSEWNERLARFRAEMDRAHPDWGTVMILGRVNQYYFTGTMQDGLLILRKDGDASYFVRRSFERANDESPFGRIFPMNSYRDPAAALGAACGITYMETETVTIGILARLRKYFDLGDIRSCDREILAVRAVKSPYELAWMCRSGEAHRDFLENGVPALLREGISEADLTAELYERMVKRGYHGISRFSMFQTEMIVGQVGFGDSSLYPTSFDGPGGARGVCPAVPLLGSRGRKLRKGDLVFVDMGFGMNGYHSDKTQVYLFGGRPDADTVKAHRGCMEVQVRTAELLKPGAIPAVIYRNVMDSLSEEFRKDFMGFGSRTVFFLGHGIGLHIDEPPVLAEGFTEPLRENMVLAVEPKKGIAGVGMVGVEDTYIVTPYGGRCITGGGRDIIPV